MKIRISFKDPDWDDGVVAEAAQQEVERVAPNLDSEEKVYLAENKAKKIKEGLREWLAWMEYVVVEFDLDADTATVIRPE